MKKQILLALIFFNILSIGVSYYYTQKIEEVSDSTWEVSDQIYKIQRNVLHSFKDKSGIKSFEFLLDSNLNPFQKMPNGLTTCEVIQKKKLRLFAEAINIRRDYYHYAEKCEVK